MLVATVLAMGGFVFAQGPLVLGDAPLPGVPTEYVPLLTVAIGLLSGWLVFPLTAIAKRLGRTSGPTTVVISAVLSLLVALVFSLVQAAATRGSLPLFPTLLAALLGFLQANGQYLARQMLARQAGGTTYIETPAAPVAPPVTPTTSGLEPLKLAGIQPLAGISTDNLFHLVTDVLSYVYKGDVPVSAYLQIGLKLSSVALDLADGNVALSSANRNKVLQLALDLQNGRAL